MTEQGMVGALINLHHPGFYIHWNFIYVSAANLIVIAVMIIVFILALLVGFPHHSKSSSASKSVGLVDGEGTSTEPMVKAAVEEDSWSPPPHSKYLGGEEDAKMWTAGIRRIGLHLLPPDKLLPDRQPAYVASWIYVFGVLTLSAFLVTVLSGVVLAIEGPFWWHVSSIGHFVNSLHLWGVEMFMFFMALHLWGKFSMAAWRGKRALTWITGALAFLVSVFEAFTGYLSQTNFDSQWIAFESKDAFNAGGIGAFVNPMNFGQALMLHIVLVPLILSLIIGVHILLVRIRGVVHPFMTDKELASLQGGGAADGLGASSVGSSELAEVSVGGAGGEGAVD